MRGGKRSDAGRKPGSPNKEKKPGKDAFLHIRCFPGEKMKIQELAKTAGMSVSDFVLSRALPPDSQETR
jgi:uncharacterized protein (DUF1778 family)